jgi:hypothetical protein
MKAITTIEHAIKMTTTTTTTMMIVVVRPSSVVGAGVWLFAAVAVVAALVAAHSSFKRETLLKSVQFALSEDAISFLVDPLENCCCWLEKKKKKKKKKETFFLSQKSSHKTHHVMPQYNCRFGANSRTLSRKLATVATIVLFGRLGHVKAHVAKVAISS